MCSRVGASWRACGGQRMTPRNLLSFHHVGSRDSTQIIKLLSGAFTPLSPLPGLTGPQLWVTIVLEIEPRASYMLMEIF